MARTFAKGKYAIGFCQRSGKKMRLRDMVRDGYYPNLIVAPEWREVRPPQEKIVPVDDPVALEHPAPDPDAGGAGSGSSLQYPLYNVLTNTYVNTAVVTVTTFLPAFPPQGVTVDRTDITVDSTAFTADMT